MNTLTKEKLLQILEPYPDNTAIEITVLLSDIQECDPQIFDVATQSKDSEPHIPIGSSDVVFPFGLPGDHGYSKEDSTVAFAVWSEKQQKSTSGSES